MSGSLALAFRITATDAASAKLDALAKRIDALARGAGTSGTNLGKVTGASTGINRLSEGMLSLGNNALGAVRAIERMVSPMMAITSTASLGGMVALEKAWSTAGNTISKTAYSLSMPASGLSRLEQGFQLAGSTAEAADTTVKGLNETIHDAFYGRDAHAQSTLNALGINWKNEQGGIADTMTALGQLSNWMRDHPDPHAQMRALTSVKGDPDALIALKDGVKGLDDAMAKADATGSVWTKQMVDHAFETQKAFARLEGDLKGIGMRIADDWSGVATRAMRATSDWIEHNQALATSLTEGIGGAIAFLSGLKVAKWVLRLLGLGAVADLPLGSALAAGAGIVDIVKRPVGNVASQADEDAITGHAPTPPSQPHPGFRAWWENLGGYSPEEIRRRWMGPGPAARPGMQLAPDKGGYFAAPGGRDSITTDLLGQLANSRLGQLIARGEAGAADYNAVNRGEAGGYAAGMENLVNMTVAQVQAAQREHRFNAAGRYQVIGPTLDKAVDALGLTGQETFDKATQDRIFEQYLIGSKRREIGDYIEGRSNDLQAALLAMSKEWASVADPTTGRSHYAGIGNNQATISADEAARDLKEAREHFAQQQQAGGVHVTVDINGAPPGTRATAVASGAATTSAPRVETPMGYAGR